MALHFIKIYRKKLVTISRTLAFRAMKTVLIKTTVEYAVDT